VGQRYSVSRFTSARASPRKARAGEVLVSSALRDLMSQSGIRFKDRGIHQLKGVPERWRLYRVEH
jgi:class 3 adenylate cyclase